MKPETRNTFVGLVVLWTFSVVTGSVLLALYVRLGEVFLKAMGFSE
jgi:hypothetical protein